MTTVSTCSTLTNDTVVSVHQGTCALLSETACNDDSCGLQSSVSFPATAGTLYRIRIASFGATAGAGDTTSGSFCIQQQQGPAVEDCDLGNTGQLPDQLGHGAAGTVGATSDANPGAGFQVADNFEPVADGSVSGLCFFGIYVNFSLLIDCGPGDGDNFSVTYYNDDGSGLTPGSVLAGPMPLTITSSGPTGLSIATGIGPIDEYVYNATHSAVAVSANTCYWVSVQNATTGSCFWLWETAPPGDGRGAQSVGGVYGATDYDLAWVLNVDTSGPTCSVVGPGNDLCEDRIAIAGEGLFAFDNTIANEDGPEHPGQCLKFGDPGVDNDVWFNWTSPCTGDVNITTCGLTGVDTKLAVYDADASDCAALPDPLDCNDDTCGFQSSVTFPAVAGNVYKLRVGTFAGAAGGAGQFQVTCVATPLNDDCADAAPLAVPGNASGNTSFANPDPEATFCGTSIDAPGVWYAISGTGTTITASTCNDAAYDTKLNVYCGDCADLACVAGVDDTAGCGLTTSLSWCSQAGATYLLLVQGFGGATGSFNLTTSEDGVACSASVQCLPAGACCIGPDGLECIITTAADCAAQGGNFKGEGTDCGGAFFQAGTCSDPFQDVCGSPGAINHVMGDDTSTPVTFGFNFDFFGTVRTGGDLASNGYLAFSGFATDFTNDACPNPFTPNDAIFPLWDDWSPNQGGSVCSVTLGTAPNRTWVGQWTNVPHFSGFGPATFQLRLNEIDNSIEFRVGAIPGGATATQGIENADASESVCFTTASGPSCTRVDYITTGNPCSECFLVFGSGDGDSVFDSNLHDFDVQVDGVFASMDVLMDQLGRVPLERVLRYAGTQEARLVQNWNQQPEPAFYVQVVMWNPFVFPSQPEQSSQGMAVTVLPDGHVYGTLYGSQVGGVQIQQPREVSIDGRRWIEFPFVIEGL
jgi:hypothetical protein